MSSDVNECKPLAGGGVRWRGPLLRAPVGARHLLPAEPAVGQTGAEPVGRRRGERVTNVSAAVSQRLCFIGEVYGGHGESLVPPRTRGSVSLSNRGGVHRTRGRRACQRRSRPVCIGSDPSSPHVPGRGRVQVLHSTVERVMDFESPPAPVTPPQRAEDSPTARRAPWESNNDIHVLLHSISPSYRSLCDGGSEPPAAKHARQPQSKDADLRQEGRVAGTGARYETLELSKPPSPNPRYTQCRAIQLRQYRANVRFDEVSLSSTKHGRECATRYHRTRTAVV